MQHLLTPSPITPTFQSLPSAIEDVEFREQLSMHLMSLDDKAGVQVIDNAT